MRFANRILLTVLVLAPLRPAQARPTGELADLATKLDDDDSVERTYGALGAQHFARRQSHFSLFSHTDLRDWQQAIAPLVPKIIELLGDDEKLEWADANSGESKQSTTPRAEATRALQALERAAIEPLIASLDNPKLAAPSDETLRLIVRGGPSEHDRPGWQRWWDAHRQQPLPNEHGQWWLPAIFLALVAGVAGFAFRIHRKAT